MTHEALATQEIPPHAAVGHLLHHAGIETVQTFDYRSKKNVTFTLPEFVDSIQWVMSQLEPGEKGREFNLLQFHSTGFRSRPELKGQDRNRYIIDRLQVSCDTVVVCVAVQSKAVNITQEQIEVNKLLSLV